LQLVCKFEENKILLEKELPQFQRLTPAAKKVLELAVTARNDAFEYVVYLAEKNNMNTWLASSEALWNNGWLYDVPILTQLELYYESVSYSVDYDTFVRFYYICDVNGEMGHFKDILEGATCSVAGFESIVSACEDEGWRLKRLYLDRIEYCKFLVDKELTLHRADHASLDSDEEYELREYSEHKYQDINGGQSFSSTELQSSSESEDSNTSRNYVFDEEDVYLTKNTINDLEILYWEDI
jgi:hypothetical protein